MKLTRHPGNPILAPNPANAWESAVTANPGAWYDEEAGLVRMLYRASAADVEHKVYLGYAESRDGLAFTRRGDEPAVVPSDGFDGGCVEDPRIVKFGDWYFIVYASRPMPAGQYWLHGHTQYRPPEATADWPVCLRENLSSSGLLLTRDFRRFIRAGRMTDPTLDDRDAILFPEKVGGRFVLLHRPMEWVGPAYGTDAPAIWISFSDDVMRWPGGRLLAKAELDWERKIGGSTPPLRTDAGWLVLYHAVRPDTLYRIGAMLLDLADPTRVTHRAPAPLMEPETHEEMEGYYKGCIFPCGNVVIDGTLFVYYGAGDRYVGAATCGLEALLAHLTQCPA